MPATHTLPACPPASPLLARYARLRDDPQLRRTLEIRARAVDAIRRSLHQHGFLDVDTPLLQRDRTRQPFPVGSAALGDRLYLRSNPLYLRGLLAAGYPRVFEFARMFRDEAVDATHQPEYTLVEIYQAGADHQHMLALAQHLMLTAATAALDTTAVPVGGCGQLLDLADQWPARPFYPALSHATGIPLDPASTSDQLHTAADRHAVALTTATPTDQAIELHDHLVQPATTALAVYTDFPAAASPLARPADHDPRLAQKWDLVIAGTELATGYTEEHETPPPTDSAGQSRPLTDEWAAVFADMPPAGGLCLGLDRLVMLLAGAPTLAESVAFALEPTPGTGR